MNWITFCEVLTYAFTGLFGLFALLLVPAAASPDLIESQRVPVLLVGAGALLASFIGAAIIGGMGWHL